VNAYIIELHAEKSGYAQKKVNWILPEISSLARLHFLNQNFFILNGSKTEIFVKKFLF
jgi:hypothetical protein